MSFSLSMLAAQRRSTGPVAEIRHLGAFAGISVLAMVHQVQVVGLLVAAMLPGRWRRLDNEGVRPRMPT